MQGVACALAAATSPPVIKSRDAIKRDILFIVSSCELQRKTE
jgi:hypothetical protein